MTETQSEQSGDTLGGQVLIAMPGMTDPRFRRSLVYLCAHSNEGAMGLIVNKHADDLKLGDLFEKLGIETGEPMALAPLHYGGPVETGRGFVLHSADYSSGESTLQVDAATSMTATIDVLQAMAENRGPSRAIVALGYAGWAPGQLEAEMRANGWLACAPDEELLFGDDADGKWDRALAKIGVHPGMLSSWGGHA
ncbi:MAG TPA: YqgE/AlgH family protein [Thermohalobaculum sp.]|nr:YqgE/AlgH family protein [Thermohalobaculum sp.]